MSEIEFVDSLPEGASGKGRMQRFVAALKERPGEWAIYDRKPKDRSSGFNNTTSMLRSYGAETAWRTIGDEKILYGRWPKEDA